MKSPKLLIDADYFFYRAASAAEDEHEYSPDLTVIVGDFIKGKNIVQQEVNNLCTRFDTKDFTLFFTDVVNFRKKIDPSYKGNRTKRKPCGYLKLKQWGLDSFPSLIKPGLEADDALGIVATSGEVDSFVLISPDKDLAQIPCRIYDLKNEYTQTPEQAERLLYMQCLAGDSTDGYKGCAGIGPKRALAVLDSSKNGYWNACVDTYKQAGLTEEDALRNLRLARILQVSDWDAEKEEPILFTP